MNQETVSSATSEIESLSTNPRIVFDILFLIQNCELETIRHAAILGIPHLIQDHKENFNSEQFGEILTNTIQQIQNEKSIRLRFNLCDVAYKTINTCEYLNLEPLVQLASQFLQTNGYLSTGLYIWDLILSSPSFPLEDGLVFNLIQIAEQSISSSDINDRIQGIKIIKKLWDHFSSDLDQQEIDIVNSLIQAILTELQSLLFDRQPDEELWPLTSLVSEEILSTPPYFLEDQQLLTFLNMGLQAILSQQVDLTIRMRCFYILENSVQLIYDHFGNQIEEIINVSALLSLHVCRIQRDEHSYDFAATFFNRISLVFEEGEEEIYEIFIHIVTEFINEGGLPERQIALIIIQSIICGLLETISDHVEAVLQLIITAGSVEDEQVFEAACAAINEMIEYVAPSLSFYIDEVSNYLFEFITSPLAISTLDSLFFHCDRPPQSNMFDDIVNRLFILLSNSDQTEAILSCISSVFSKLTTTTENYVQNMIPLLSEILQNRVELRGAVVEFIGMMVKVAPMTIRSELPIIIDYAIGLFTGDTESTANYSAATFFGNAALVLPLSLSSYLPRVVPTLIDLLTLKPVTGNEIETDQLRKTHNSAAFALCALVGKSSHLMTDYIQFPILNYLTNIQSPIEINTIAACRCISYAAEGLLSLGIDISEIIKLYINPFLSSDNKPMISDIMMMFGKVLAVYGTQTPLELIKVLYKHIPSAISGQLIHLYRSECLNCIDLQLQQPLFYFIDQFIDACGTRILELYEGLFIALQLNFKSHSPMLRGYSLRSAAKLCYACSITTEPFHVTLENAINNIGKNRNLFMRRSISQSLQYLLFTSAQEMQRHFTTINQFAEELLQENESVMLWCALFSNTSEVVNIDQYLSHVVSHFPTSYETEEISFAAMFACSLLVSYQSYIDPLLPKIASELLASNDQQIQKVQSDVLRVSAQTLSRLNENDLLNLVNSNESKLAKISSHLQIVLNQTQSE